MLLSPRVKLLVAFWATAEALVFLAVVHVVGLGGALLAGLAATFLGGWLLKRTGAAAVLRLRATLSGRGESAPGEILDGTVRALAAMALAVRSGLGIGSLPDWMTGELDGLVRLLPTVKPPRVEAYFVYPEELRNSKRVAVFRDFLLGQLQAKE